MDGTDNTNIGDIITPVSATFDKPEAIMKNAVNSDNDLVNLASHGKEKEKADNGVGSNFSSTPNLITAQTNAVNADKKASVSVEL